MNFESLPKRRRSGESGFSILEVVIAVGVVSIVMAGMMIATSSQLKVQSQSNMTFQLDSTRRDLKQMLNNGSAWANTIADPANSTACSAPSSACNPLSCLAIPSTCISGSGGDIFIVRDFKTAPGNVVYDWSANKGLTPRGTSCPGYVASPAIGNDDCPIQFQVSWKAECGQPVGTACGTSRITPHLAIQPVYNPGPKNKVVFNPDNYAANFYQGSDSVGCTWADTPSGLVETCADVGIKIAKPLATLDVGGPAIVRAPLNTTNLVSGDMGNLLSFQSNWASGVNRSFFNIALETNCPTCTRTVVFRNPMRNPAFTDDAWLMSFRIFPTLNADVIGVFGGATNNANDQFNIIKGNLNVMSGKLGVGLSAPAYSLDSAGDINSYTAYRVSGTLICSISGCTAVSDERLKKNIMPLKESLDRILQLRGVSYDWKDPVKYGASPQVGLIAQATEKVFPEIVVTDEKTGLKSLRYDHLVAPIIEAIRTINTKLELVYAQMRSFTAEYAKASAALNTQALSIQELNERLTKLENRNSTLEQEVTGLRAENYRLRKSN